MQRELTCILCPQGCSLEATLSGDELVQVSGNRCPRGEKYAKEEIFHPTRTLTTTVKVDGGIYQVIPVKTAQPIPKEKIFAAMAEINQVLIQAPVTLGQIIIEDLADTGVQLVASRPLAKSDLLAESNVESLV